MAIRKSVTSATISSISPDTGKTGDFDTSAQTLTLNGNVTIVGTGGANPELGVWAVSGGTTVYLGTATVSASGSWTIASSVALPQGEYTLQVFKSASQTYPGGTPLSSQSLIVDTTPPTETISSTIVTNTGSSPTIASGGLTKDNTLGLSGTVSDANGVSQVQIWDGSTYLGNATVTNGAWSFTTGVLSDGAHSFTAVAYDTAGNETTTAPITATVEATPPTVAINAIAGGQSLNLTEVQAGFPISGTSTGAAGQSITVQFYNGATQIGPALTTTVASDGSWTVSTPADLPLNPSAGYSVQASVTDPAGNSGSSALPISTDATVCFMAGTRIATPAGEAEVETLRPGDLVLTHDGRTVPVCWLGRQTVSTIFTPKLRVLPIRIKAGALADNVPARDLLVSPDHAMLVGGILVHAGALVNGASIMRETDVPTAFTYYHVETDDHSLILAEGAPAETFVDNVDRLHFDNWAEHEALYPQGKTIDELPYPRAKSHRQTPVYLRVMLTERAMAIGALAGTAVA
jgi:hypothetical protein